MNYHKNFLKLLRIIKEKITGNVDFEHFRPLFAKNYNLKSDELKQDKSIAIIIQGPLVTKNNFTLETVKIYKKIFSPTVKIIISTWDGEDEEMIAKLKKEGVTVLLNKKPHNGGIKNINFQIISTKNGIAEAKKYNVYYILKTRTDQRMYATNIESFLCSIIDLFPLSKKNIQQKRIIAVSLNTYKYRPYSVSDMTLFGTIHDIEKYFDVKEDTRTETNFNNIKTWSQNKLCEVYLLVNFLEKIGRKPTYTLEDSWNVYSEHFCIIDASMLDLFWYKYDYWKEYRDMSYKYMKNTQELNFREWTILYNAIETKKYIPEYLLEQNFGNNIVKTH